MLSSDDKDDFRIGSDSKRKQENGHVWCVVGESQSFRWGLRCDPTFKLHPRGPHIYFSLFFLRHRNEKSGFWSTPRCSCYYTKLSIGLGKWRLGNSVSPGIETADQGNSEVAMMKTNTKTLNNTTSRPPTSSSFKTDPPMIGNTCAQRSELINTMSNAPLPLAYYPGTAILPPTIFDAH